jgi:SAM-dependent methyltransferase
MGSTKQPAWKKRGFKIMPGWLLGDRKWFRTSIKKLKRLETVDRTPPETSTGVYVRTLGFIKEKYNFDIANDCITLALKRKRSTKPLNILDAGAGFGFISAELVAKFRNAVNVTALGLNPRVSFKRVKQLIDVSLASDEWYANADSQRLYHAQKALPEYEKNIGKVKRVISRFENYKTKEKYDVIFSLFGPHFYSPFKRRVAEQLFNLLKPGGQIITITALYDLDRSRAFFDPKSRHSQRSGYYLKLTKTTKNLFFYKKVKVAKTK